jgi:hypothetical protein
MPLRYLPSPSGHAAHHGGVQFGDIGELVGVVRLGKDRLREVPADLGGIHIDAKCEFDVSHVIIRQLGVHNAGDDVVFFGVLVELDALHQGGGAVAHPDDRDAYFFVSHEFCSP